ncbi:MAG: hypothetical protein HY243_17325 [Proteobacteria bacterium]|nr:hypothetical protein [Pseudomonadota bacterium]
MVATVAPLLLPPLLAAPIVFYFFRHWMLTALIVLAPLPAALVGMAVNWQDFIGLGSFDYFSGMIVAGLMADEYVIAFAGGESKRLSMRSANRRILPTLAAFAISGVITLVWVGTAVPDAWLFLMRIFGLGLTLTFVSVVGLMQLSQALSYDEAFIAHTNRFREKAERLFDRLLVLTQPRWAFSISGIAIVLSAIALFGFGPDVLQKSVFGKNLFAGPILLATLVACIAATVRNWRVTLASVLVMAWVILIRSPFPQFQPETAIFVLCLASQIAIYARSGDEMIIAVGRTLTRSGLGVAAMVSVLIPFVAAELIEFHGFAHPMARTTLAAGMIDLLAALVFLPSFAVAIETLCPRRETLEARYRVH